ncbi:hypothetical protein NOX82_27550 [Pseudomonas citronellolis]|uniref:hypothetical protein n=1 Tax=Pseudomonas citronellolis TaxID=53408 RepID=UPI0021124B24|nr:hypothetical protein [Pseudomonas citronellolis]UUC53575.1 hypothetical protein NOX82_27550 [Pseudomonas citronellolis]
MNNCKLNTHLSESDIGQIQRSDQSIRRHTHKAMKYLVKDGQHLRLKPAGALCLRKGTLGRYRRGAELQVLASQISAGRFGKGLAVMDCVQPQAVRCVSFKAAGDHGTMVAAGHPIRGPNCRP